MCPRSHRNFIPQRTVDLAPQMAEQLVEVPTVLYPSLLQQRIAEQIVDIPVLRGRESSSVDVFKVSLNRILQRPFPSRPLTFQFVVVECYRGLQRFHPGSSCGCEGRCCSVGRHWPVSSACRRCVTSSASTAATWVSSSSACPTSSSSAISSRSRRTLRG